jgi:hypothetical protein
MDTSQARTFGQSSETEWLAAELADDVDFWRAKAEAHEAVVRRLARELERAEKEARISDAWRRGLASQLDDLTIPEVGPALLAKGSALALLIALALWAVLGGLAFGAYALFVH